MCGGWPQKVGAANKFRTGLSNTTFQINPSKMQFKEILWGLQFQSFEKFNKEC